MARALTRGPVGRRLRKVAPLAVPVLLAIADAMLVNGVELDLEVGVSMAAAAALLVRRRFPLLVFLFTLPGLYIGYIWFAPMIALYTLAALRPGRARLGGCALLLIAAHFFPYPISDFELTDYRENTLVLIDASVTSAAPIALGLLVRTRRELASRVEDLTRSLRREDRLLADRVKTTERARLAREMHDVVAHQVSLISLQAGAVQVSTEDAEARAGARTIRELSVRTLEELRHMVGVLRADGGEAAEARDLAPQPDLEELPRLIEMSALDVTYERGVVAGAGGVSGAKTVERAAFRTVQEALTNVRKHAPGARVRVRVDPVDTVRSPATDGAEVADGTQAAAGTQPADGAGAADGAAASDGGRTAHGLRVEIRNGPPDATATVPALPGGGHGLVGLRERAQSLGGTLEARRTSDGGFVVRAEFPYGTGRSEVERGEVR
ncbi:Signal transduction histidine kinase [Streptomyces sp. 2112.3]|uniref:sensor histidine kinase n=1 Tax=Streptomyces sp. 2112.3 TaxID=1881023 RepID=UPI00089D1EBB|nr:MULTISPECIES: histidine kinase [unclassified Streptomyces]SEE51490.1 Signal transduction histidine kinase [Streptomyces sp. 2112.3]